jgi:hypothetical protein
MYDHGPYDPRHHHQQQQQQHLFSLTYNSGHPKYPSVSYNGFVTSLQPKNGGSKPSPLFHHNTNGIVWDGRHTRQTHDDCDFGSPNLIEKFKGDLMPMYSPAQIDNFYSMETCKKARGQFLHVQAPNGYGNDPSPLVNPHNTTSNTIRGNSGSVMIDPLSPYHHRRVPPTSKYYPGTLWHIHPCGSTYPQEPIRDDPEVVKPRRLAFTIPTGNKLVTKKGRWKTLPECHTTVVRPTFRLGSAVSKTDRHLDVRFQSPAFTLYNIHDVKQRLKPTVPVVKSTPVVFE